MHKPGAEDDSGNDANKIEVKKETSALMHEDTIA
jgi:hypothetical protein